MIDLTKLNFKKTPLGVFVNIVAMEILEYLFSSLETDKYSFDKNIDAIKTKNVENIMSLGRS